MSEVAVLEREEISQVEVVEELDIKQEDSRNEIKYQIGDFECPLEMIWQIIKDEGIDIENIFVSSLTSKYLEALKSTPKDELDYEYMSNFIATAAELVRLKAKAVTQIQEYDEVFDEECTNYIDKLKLYDLYKQQTEKLREREVTNRFYIRPKYTEKDYRVQLKDFEVNKLVQAYANAVVSGELNRTQDEPKVIKQLKFSAKDKEVEIKSLIINKKYMKFTDLIEEDFDKSDIVTTFFAVLSLCKYGIVDVLQHHMFGEIDIIGTANAHEIEIAEEEGDAI